MLTDKIRRQCVRFKLVTGRDARFVYVHPDAVESLGDLGAVALVADARVSVDAAWVLAETL